MDGQIEVLNHILKQYLCFFFHQQPSCWFRFLSLAEWSYNTATHSAMGLSPFHVFYGKAPPFIPQYLLGSSLIEAVDQLLFERKEMLSVLQWKLTKAQL